MDMRSAIKQLLPADLSSVLPAKQIATLTKATDAYIQIVLTKPHLAEEAKQQFESVLKNLEAFADVKLRRTARSFLLKLANFAIQAASVATGAP